MNRRLQKTTGMLATALLSALTACGGEPGTVEWSQEPQTLSGQESYLYLRCNATSWDVVLENRLVPTSDPNRLTLTYEVKQPWMVTDWDDCVLTETPLKNQWGAWQRYYVLNVKDAVVDSTYSVVEGQGNFKVKYPQEGTYTATVDWRQRTLRIEKHEDVPVVDPACYAFRWAIGGEGAGRGQFRGAFDLAVRDNGVSFVVDQFNKRIQTFDNSGKFLGAFGTGNEFPTAVALSGKDLFVSVTGPSEALRNYDEGGKLISEWKVQGMTSSLAQDGKGNFYAARIVAGFPYRYFITKFDKKGNVRKEWGGDLSRGPGKFDRLWGLAVSGDRLYATDMGRVQVFDLQGKFLSQFSLPGGDIDGPHDIAADSQGFLYVADHGRAGLWKLKADGQVVTFLALDDLGGQGYQYPVGVAVTAQGRLYLSGIPAYVLKFAPCQNGN